MNDAVVSEFLIALFAGMVGFAMLRRGTPRAVELVLWIGLIWVCVLGVTSTHDKQARELTSAAVWGSTQIMGTMSGLLGQGLVGWVSQNRMAVADWVVLMFGLDLLTLVILRTHRRSAGWQPRVRLRDWMEMPRPSKAPQPALAPVASGVDELNERFNRWAPVATAGGLTQLTLFLLWAIEVVLPATGRKLREAALAANGARRRLATADWQGMIAEPRRLAEVVDVDTLAERAASVRGWASGALDQVASAPQFDWTGGYAIVPPHLDGGIDDYGPDERDRRDRLAS
jgi:hypothetical protein